MTVRILVADDSITIQKIVAMAFENEDAEVEGIGDGQEAFDKIPDFKPDIVLADVDMPGLDGFQLCQKIKGAPELVSIKVLLLASDFEDFDEERFKKCQAENHISKPFKSDDIVQMVTRVMEGSSVAENEPALQESLAEEEPTVDNEPSLEELLESVEKLSTEGIEETGPEDPLKGIEDIPLPVEIDEPSMQEEGEIVEEPSTVIDDDILSGMIQDVENEIKNDSDSMVAGDNDILSDMIQEVEQEISHDPVSEATSDNDILSGMIQDVENEIKNDSDSTVAGDNDILSDMIQEVEQEISHDPVSEATSDNDILSDMIQEVETELQDPISEPATEDPVLEEQTFSEDFEVYAEVQTGKMENLDDLDSAFKEIVAGDSQPQSVAPSDFKESEMSALGGIVPEPEDLLERMAPGAFSESERRPHTPDEINKNLNAITGSSSFESTHYQDSRLQEMDYENNDDRFIQVTGEQVKHVLEKSLDSSLQKEMSGLSEIIVKTIREVVREITPEIARSVIREEIEKIKKV